MKRFSVAVFITVVAAFFIVSGRAVPAAGAVSAQDLMSKLSWRNIGPFIGGRVVAVAGVPQTPNVFYMGAVDGGIWKSTDYGVQWNNVSDGQIPGIDNSIGALAVAPSNPSIIYAGTGETDIRGTMITGNGVYRSSDAGRTWQAAGLKDTHTIGAIAIDPRNSNVVYAAAMGHVFKDNAERGIFKSTDGGKSWSKVLYVNAGTGAIDLAMDSKHPDVLYAAMWQAYRTPWKLSSGGPGSALYKTGDGGAHWTKLSTSPGFAHTLLGKIGVAVSASNPRTVYAIVQARDGGVFRSDDAGRTWRRVNSDWKLRQRAFYYMAIFVDPTNPNTVYVPNVDALQVSHNGGRTFTRLRPPHGDNHIVWINPRNPRILLEGNDGGATVSTDGGATWSQEHNQPTGQFYHVALDNRFPFHVYGAQQDEGSIEGPSASFNGAITSDDWHNVAYGESTFVAPQPDDPNITYGSGYFSIFLRYDMRTGEFRSVSPWPNYQEGASSAELRYRLAWTHPIFFSPADPHELLVAAQYVLRSRDDGMTWQRMSPDLTRNDKSTEGPTGGPIDLDQTSAEVYPYISALAVSPLGGSVMWAGSSDGLVHMTDDGGVHWRAVTPTALPQWAEITSIDPSPVSAGAAYLTASRYMWDDFHPYVFQTIDYGKHWSTFTAGLPSDQYVYVVRQDPRVPNLLFAGTRSTVYTSFDSGATWRPLTLNLPGVQVRDIAIDTRQGDVAIATHGRAFWILDNLTLLEQLASGSGTGNDLQLFAPQNAWLSHAYGGGGFPRPGAGTNPPFGATIFFHVPSSYNGVTRATLSFIDAQGHTIRSFTLHARGKHSKLTPAMRDQMAPAQIKANDEFEQTTIAPGMNRFQWDLRYPDATEVMGFWVPVAAGGLDDTTQGPTVIPGTYYAVLNYGGQTIRRPFTVALDPRLHPAAGGLAARLALQQQVHSTLDSLDRTINEAIAMRLRLAKSRGLASRNRAAALGSEIGNLVQLDVHSSEGTLLHETKLRSHLAYLAAELDLAYDKPTSAQYQVYDALHAQAVSGEQTLRGLMTKAP